MRQQLRANSRFVPTFLVCLLVTFPAISLPQTSSQWRPNSKEFAVGETPKSYFIQRFGETTERDVIFLAGGTKDAGNVTSLAYMGSKTSSWFSSSVRSGVSAYRILALQFNDDVLMAYRFSSTYKEDSTDFDETKTSLIEKGKTAQADVINILGEPSGMGIYPSALQKGDIRLLYHYQEYDSSTFVLLKKNLQIDVGQEGIVRDFDLNVERTENVRYADSQLPRLILVPLYRNR